MPDNNITPEEFKKALVDYVENVNKQASAKGAYAACMMIKERLESESLTDSEKISECLTICNVLIQNVSNNTSQGGAEDELS